eukprot:g7894.t1
MMSGNVLSFGVNDDGALGRTTTEPGAEEGDPTIPGSVELPIGSGRPIQVVCTDSASFILTDDGAVYGCGTFRNARGVFGFSRDVKIQSRLVKIYRPTYRNPRVVKLCAGGNHVLAILEDGGALTWGDGEQGQLGRIPIRTSRRGNNLRTNMLTPTRIGGFRGVQFIDGRQLAIHPAEGITNEDTLDLEDRVDRKITFLNPTYVEALENNCMVSVACGKDHSIGVDVRGRVYSWGVPTYGVLGREEMIPFVEESTPNPTPELVSGIKAPVKEVACGQVISGCIDADGDIYTWGASLNDMLGVNVEEDVLVPQKIPRNQGMKDKMFHKMAFGGQHVALLGQ